MTNDISDQYERVEYPKDLEQLIYGYSQLVRVPCNLVRFKQLKRLQLNGNRLARGLLPLCRLTNLQHLALAFCGISRLPPQFAQMTALQHLRLQGNPLTVVPPPLASLTNLQELILSTTRLGQRTTPGEVALADLNHLCPLTQLRHLDLSTNLYLTALPIALRSLTALQTLDVRLTSPDCAASAQQLFPSAQIKYTPVYMLSVDTAAVYFVTWTAVSAAQQQLVDDAPCPP